MSKRRMVGWTPMAVENMNALAEQTSALKSESAAVDAASEMLVEQQYPVAAFQDPQPKPPQPQQVTAHIHNPTSKRRRMDGWQPLTVANDTPMALPAAGQSAVAVTDPAPAAETVTRQSATAPVTESLPRRRMEGWSRLQIGHPDTVAAQPPAPEAVAEPAASSSTPRRVGAAVVGRRGATPMSKPASKRMGIPAAAPACQEQSQVTMPEVFTPQASATVTKPETTELKPMSKTAKVVLALLGVAVVAAGLVVLAQWLRTLESVAEFISTYDGTPTHPDGVEPGIPAWVGWQHFFNFFIIVMVIRSGLLIRNQERPEAYWTPNEGGFYSPNKKNTPQKVSIQQWIHQSFNVLWVVNGLIFYVMVFATGHWMRIVPTNLDIFPNMVSAVLQYGSLDWPTENSWVYYNALQIMTYFITVFIAAPIAALTGLRLSTWWPQKTDRLNAAFPLPVARSIHFITMLYFILFIIVHLFLVFTTGVLTNMNIMFAARDAGDWIGIAVFAVSVSVTVGVAWLIKPIFVSPIAEQTGTVSTR